MQQEIERHAPAEGLATCGDLGLGGGMRLARTFQEAAVPQPSAKATKNTMGSSGTLFTERRRYMKCLHTQLTKAGEKLENFAILKLCICTKYKMLYCEVAVISSSIETCWAPGIGKLSALQAPPRGPRLAESLPSLQIP